MADDVATFGFDIDPSGAQQGASAAADAVAQLQDQLDEGTAALAEMSKAMRLLKGGDSTDIQAYKSLRDAIVAKKTSVSQLTAELLSQGKAQDVLRNKHREAQAQQKADAAGAREREKLKKQETDAAKKAEAERKKLDAERAKQQKESLDALKAQHAAMADSARTLGGPLGGLLNTFKALKSVMGAGAMAAGAFAIAAAYLALAVAVGVAVVALTRFAIVSANARRDELLQLEGLTKMRNWYGIAAGKATDLQHAIDGVSNKVHLGRGEINGMTEALYKANLRGEALKQGLEAVALATAAGGAAQGAFYQNMVVSAARSGVQVQRILDDARARYGELAARKMLSLDVQSAKFRENLDGLFRNVKIEGFLKALNSVAELFSQATVEGRALQQIVTIVLNPLIGGLEKGGPLAKRFFQGMILGGQELMITVLTIALLGKKTFGDILPKNIDTVGLALKAGKVAVLALAGAVVGLGFVITAAMALAAAPLIGLAVIIGLPIYALFKLVQAIKKVGDSFGVDWGKLGLDLVLGLVNGILGGIPQVVSAVVSLGAAAKDALKKAWDSHSPSREFEREGLNTGSGAAGGIQRGIPQVEAAASELGRAATIAYKDSASSSEAPDFPRRKPDDKPPATGAAAAGNTYNVTIHAETEEGGRAAAKGFRAELGETLSGVAVSLGAPKAA